MGICFSSNASNANLTSIGKHCSPSWTITNHDCCPLLYPGLTSFFIFPTITVSPTINQFLFKAHALATMTPHDLALRM